jgi:cell division protein FtsW
MPRAAAPAARRKPRQYPLEYNLLLTVTLCLLAAGAVMVYSASSARTLLQGQGDGTTYLVRYVLYGAIGFGALHVLSRRGLAAIASYAGPLLALSFGLLVAVKLPGIGVSVNGARR